MNGALHGVRELIGWNLDEYAYRPRGPELDERLHCARRAVDGRAPFPSADPVDAKRTAALRGQFALQALRPDLQAEMEGLQWSFAVVDLRLLLAFQRRLSHDPSRPRIVVPSAEDWQGLVDLSFGPAKPVVCDLIRSESTIVLRSGDPNLQFRVSRDASSPIRVYAGSPFFEVAQYRGRWFLRDGYHRAYAALRAGVCHLPAVAVQAATLEELGADRPWLFPEEILFSDRPPRVVDLLNDALTIEYHRPPLIRTLRVTMEEFLAPATPTGGHS